MELGNAEEAREYIERAGQLFQEHVELHKESGIMAHYWLAKGRWAAAQGADGQNIMKARVCFEEALRIRRKVELYPKGEADALVGIAWTHAAEGNYALAWGNFWAAVKRFPPVLARGFI